MSVTGWAQSFMGPLVPSPWDLVIVRTNAYNQGVNIVLYEPDIPWNTGNIGRTCVATGSALHLVGRLGFSTEAKEVRRSGLDYWDKVKLVRHANWDAFLASIPPYAPLFLFSRWAKNDLWDANFQSYS